MALLIIWSLGAALHDVLGAIHKGRPHRGEGVVSMRTVADRGGRGEIDDADVRKKYYIG